MTKDGAQAIHHVGIAVRDLDAAIERYGALYGATVLIRRALPEQGVEAAALTLPGAGELELISPLDPESGVARFLASRGEGLHHVALAVTDVEASLARVTAEGGRLVDTVPRIGLHGTRVAFVHPTAGFGVLTELVEMSETGSTADG